MSVFLIVLIMLALLVLFAMLLGGYIVPTERIEELKQSIKSFGRRTTEVTGRFRAWVERALTPTPELQAWLLSLSEEGLQALTQRVDAFCSDVNINLAWLVDQDIDVAPELKQTVQTIVVDYLTMCWKAVQHQNDIALFGYYYQAVRDPSDGRYRELRRKLFTRLTADGLAEQLPAYELIMASETQRQAMAAEAIQQVAANDWNNFTRIFQEVLQEDNDTAPRRAAA